jgi:hypothetical protein
MDLLISTVSTLNLEGAIFDKPLISIGFDGEHSLPFALSTARYYRYDHMLPVVNSGGMVVAYTIDELVRCIREYLQNPTKDAAGRHRIAEDLVGECGEAGKRVAQFIIEKCPS